jgi:hypothetical protein
VRVRERESGCGCESEGVSKSEKESEGKREGERGEMSRYSPYHKHGLQRELMDDSDAQSGSASEQVPSHTSAHPCATVTPTHNPPD